MGKWCRLLWLVIALVLFIFQIATILVVEFRNPSKSVAWLMILFIFPIVGFVVYYFLAREYKQRRKMRRKDRKLLDEMRRGLELKARALTKDPSLAQCAVFQEQRMMGLLTNMPEAPITSCNRVRVLSDAATTYEAIFTAIEQAKQFVHLEYYIVRDDHTGRRLQELLIRKVSEGVRVRFIVDGLGCYKLSASYINELRNGGVELYGFLPPVIAFFDKRINYRNHRKIVVVDGLIGFLGGINIGDEYLGKDPRFGYWRDTHLQVQGDSVYYLQHTFATDWAFVSGQPMPKQDFFPEHDCAEPDKEHMQIIASGPDAPWDAVQEVFFSAMATAKHRIYITTPYFIPDPSIAMALKTAAFSGIDVRIIIPLVPDTKIIHWASLSYVKEFMLAGVRFYQYRKGFVHAKTLIIDHMLGTVGTANMDMRSFFSNFEIMAVLYERNSIERLERDFQEDMRNSIEIDPVAFSKRSRFIRGREVIARLLSPLF